MTGRRRKLFSLHTYIVNPAHLHPRVYQAASVLTVDQRPTATTANNNISTISVYIQYYDTSLLPLHVDLYVHTVLQIIIYGVVEV